MSAKVSAKKSSNSGFIIALVGILIAGGGFIWWKTQQPPPAPVVVLPTVTDSLLASKAQGYTMGSPDAKVEIVEFADFECHFCAKAHETVMGVMKSYGDKVRLVFRHYPLSFHAKAPKAAEATACADEQGKFWELHDVLFESQELAVEALKMQAKRTGLDEEKFNSCLDSGRTAPLVKRDMTAGQQVGVSGTPAFFINGFMLSGAQPEEAFRKLIDAELARLGE